MSKVWQCLEEIRGLLAVPVEWRAWLGTDFDVFKTAFLRKLSGLADSIPCPHEPGQSHLVAPRGDEFVAVCAFGCPDMLLKLEDVELWEVNPSKLGRAVCKAFECDVRTTELHLPLTWQVGAKFANAVPVVLTIQNGREDFRNVVAELVARWRQRFILFAPTSRFVDAVCTERLENVHAGFFDLESHVTLTTQGHLRACKPPGELFARFAPDAKEPVSEDVARALFALIEKLESGEKLKPPSVMEVFRLYCIKGMTTDQIVAECNYSKGTVINRLKRIRATTRTKPDMLRAYSPHFEKIESALTDSRAEHIHRKSSLDAPKDEMDE